MRCGLSHAWLLRLVWSRLVCVRLALSRCCRYWGARGPRFRELSIVLPRHGSEKQTGVSKEDA